MTMRRGELFSVLKTQNFLVRHRPEAISEFSLDGLDFELEQTVFDVVEDDTRTGSNLIQTYRCYQSWYRVSRF